MADSLGVNNYRTWTVQVPRFQAVSNPWAYDMFNASPTVMYPSTNDSAYWDKQCFNFGCDSTNMLNNSTAMLEQMMPALQQWQASVAKQFQEIMSKIQSGNGNVGGVNSDVDIEVGGANNNSGSSKKLKEGQIIETLNKMGVDSGIKDRFNKEITIEDKDGNEKKTTLLRRLIELTKDYQENPDEALLSDVNYRMIWDIAGKYAETGELTSEDYKILLEIAKKPGGKKAGGSDGEDENGEKVSPNAEQRDSTTITSIVNDLIGGIENDGYWGTDKDKITTALDPETGIRKGNVLEVMESYRKKIKAYPNEKQDLVSGILDDFGGWGAGDASWWSLKMGSDDAKVRLEAIREALVERANEFIKANGEKKGITKADVEAFVLPENRNDDAIKSLFNNFVTKLTAAEGAVYKKEN